LEKRVELEEVREAMRLDEECIAHENEKDLECYRRHQKVKQDFISKFQPGDEIWIYNFPDKYWENFMGRKGYVIMRKGKMIGELMIMCN